MIEKGEATTPGKEPGSPVMKTGGPMRLVGMFGAALLCSATAPAQSIVGNVSTTFGVPIPGVLVTGTRSSPFQQVTDTTDTAGDYSLGTHLSGTYSVVPTKSGYTFT